MANSKSKARAQAQQRARAQAKKAAARTAPPVRATPTSPARSVSRPVTVTATAAASPPDAGEPDEAAIAEGPPSWFQWTTLVLALLGLGISIYETYAHYTGNKLAGCSANPHGTFDCTAVITSSQSMVFNVIPVAILGLAFYVAAVPLFSPWCWRFAGRGRVSQQLVGRLRLASIIIGMGFVVYLIYAEVYQIGQVCEYCTGVHIVTFLLFCMTLVAAAWWGLGQRSVPEAKRDATS
ncbi:MAG TPA: vitamin K epoxide reductase family protein [Trebonia sp.]|nr:vitamin K epoxide reductase family protein [Trebonia sp.]